MSSVVAGYEYDIFVSYHHNDNLPSQGFGRQADAGWVMEFMKTLQEEPSATIKEPVSAYADTDDISEKNIEMEARDLFSNKTWNQQTLKKVLF